MNINIDDSQFAALFKEPISADYKNALLFMNVNPDLSLLKFRQIIETLCSLYANKYHYKFKAKTLLMMINELESEQLIAGVTKAQFHRVRELANEGVHQQHLPLDDLHENSAVELVLKENKEVLKVKAVESRKGVLDLLESAFLSLKIGGQLPRYEVIAAGGQECKDLLFNCLCSTDYKEHHNLGLVYQGLAEEHEILARCDDSFVKRPNPRFIFAAESFKSAVYFSAGLIIDEIIQSGGKNISINPDSYESLFSYTLLCLKGKVDDKSSEEKKILLHALVSRGFVEAYSYLGWSYYVDGDYKKAHKYITHAKAKKDIFTIHKLGVLYSEGKACPVNVELALDWFNRAIESGCADSMLELGKLYHKGELVDQDDRLAQEYLNQSIARGSWEAFQYYNDNYFNINEKCLALIEQVSDVCKKQIQEAKKSPYIAQSKVGRNDDCSCGSGQKYKKCCLQQHK